MPGGGKLRFFKEKRELYTKYKQLISTLKMVTLARYRQSLPRIQSRDQSMTFTKSAFFVSDADEQNDPTPPQANETKVLYVPITTNRGSCGAMNTSIVRYISKMDSEKYKVLVVGKKGQDTMSKVLAKNYIGAIINDMKQAISFAYAAEIAAKMFELQQTEKFDRTAIIFTRYVSASAQRMSVFNIPKFETWLDNIKKGSAATGGKEDKNPYYYSNTLMEADANELQNYYTFEVAQAILHAVSENELSEYASRLVAVENQLTNITGLLLASEYNYNKTRKELITSELLEIISTMSAIQGGGKGGKVPKPEFYVQ